MRDDDSDIYFARLQFNDAVNPLATYNKVKIIIDETNK